MTGFIAHRYWIVVATGFCFCLLFGCNSSQLVSVNRASKSSSPPQKSALSHVDVNHPIAILQEGRHLGSGIFSPDGKLFVARSVTGFKSNSRSTGAVVWNSATWKPERKLKDASFPISFSDDGDRFLAINDTRTAHVWDTKSWTVILSRPAHGGEYPAALSPQGTELAVFSQRSPSDRTSALRLWDVESGKLLHTYRYAPSDRAGLILGFSPDGRNLAIDPGRPEYGRSNDAKIMELSTGKQIHAFADGKYILGYSPDGQVLVTQDLTENYGIDVWDTQTWKIRRRLSGPNRYIDIRSVSFSRDPKLMAVFEFGGGIHLWNLTTGQKLQHIDSEVGIGFVALSPDGQYLAASFTDPSDKEVIKVLRISSGQEKS